MPFDIASLETQSLSEAGVAMPLFHPRTGQVVRDENDREVTITLLGRNSKAFRDKVRAITEKAQERRARGVQPTNEEIRADDVDLITACTRDWSFVTMDGQAFPPTPDNIRKFWSDLRYQWIFERAQQFVNSDGNFLAT
jgi:hypothetical protein